MTNSNNDIEELEELLTELEGQEARLVTPYSEEDDAVTQLMDAPLGDQEWMVQVTALDRRMMSTDQLLSELQMGKVSNKTLVWRGGMDDWLPVSRVDELARMSRPPSSPMMRPSLGSLPPPPAPLPPPPAWSTAAGASLPPPPTALPPPPSAAMGLPRPQRPLPVPAPISREPQTNTTRPVAVDFADLPAGGGGPLQSKRVVMALSAAAILAGFVTLYAVFGGGGDKSSVETEAAAQPQAVNSLKPAVQEKQEKKVVAQAPAPTPKPAEVKPEPVAAAESEAASAEGSSSANARATNAPARYAPRADARRRTRGSAASESGSDAEEPAANSAASSEAPAPSAPAQAAEAPSSEVAVAADDDADSSEAPKSTGKGNSTFNRDAAKTALDEAAAQAKNCRPQGGPSGTGRVQVRYEPSGKVAAVSILTSKFDNTTAGSCVRMLFRRARVPEFTGVPVVVVNKSFEIP